MTTTTRFTDIDQFLTLLKGVKPAHSGFTALCPGHTDHNRSLTIKLEDNKLLLHCFAGCDINHIVESIGLTTADLFLTSEKQATRKIVAVYPYFDENGNLLYQVVRTEPKGFYQQRPDGKGGFILNLIGVTPTIYQLPKIKTAVLLDEPLIVIPEGEKDCDNCFRKMGIVATCNSGGAGKWRSEFGEYLKGAQTIVVIADKDKQGREHAPQVARSLIGKVTSVKVIEMPGNNIKDLSDWITAGGDEVTFRKLVTDAPEYTETQQTKTNNKQTFDWRQAAVPHSELLNCKASEQVFLVEGFITKSCYALMGAKPKIGKSICASQLAQCAATETPFLGMKVNRTTVVYLQLENGKLRERKRLDMQHSDIPIPTLTYFFEWQYLNTPEGQPGLLIIDTLSKAVNAKLDQNDAGQAADLGYFLHKIAVDYDMVVFVIHHHGKMSSGDPGTDLRGSSAWAQSADLLIGLYKNEDGSCNLKTSSRDTEEIDLRLKLDKEVTWTWQNMGEDKDIRQIEARQKIHDALDILGEASAVKIAEEIGLTRPAVQQQCKPMRENGELDYRVNNRGEILYKNR
jgi:hypothetical protein